MRMISRRVGYRARSSMVYAVSQPVDKSPTTEPISGRRSRKNRGTRFHLTEGKPWTVSLPGSTGVRGHGHRHRREREKKDRTGSVPLYRKRMGKRGRGVARRQTYDVVLRFVKIPAFQILERVPLTKHLLNLSSPSYFSFRRSFVNRLPSTPLVSPLSYHALQISVSNTVYSDNICQILARGFSQFRRICDRPCYKYDFVCVSNV